MLKDYIQSGAEIFIGLGLFAFGGGYLISKVKGGEKEQKKESTDLLSTSDQIKEIFRGQNEDLKIINKSLSDKIEVLTREVGEIRGQLNAETKTKEEYLAILQGKDKESKQFMEIMMTFVNKQTENNLKQNDTNLKIMEILNTIDARTKDEHDRDFKIDATITKT